jgi:hypothetical protein
LCLDAARGSSENEDFEIGMRFLATPGDLAFRLYYLGELIPIKLEERFKFWLRLDSYQLLILDLNFSE